MTKFRRYDEKRDKEAVARIWREVGWIEKEEHEEAMEKLQKWEEWYNENKEYIEAASNAFSKFKLPE